MSNSRAILANAPEKTRTVGVTQVRGLSLEAPYKPGFVDDLDLESVKMAVDRELSTISIAFHETTERLSKLTSRVEALEALVSKL